MVGHMSAKMTRYYFYLKDKTTRTLVDAEAIKVPAPDVAGIMAATKTPQ